ncbi:hypothetical protein TNCV_1722681 [Trichonephila clavipes]|nr:hypothetical protein TNCV_1722681 [Trichonephila clavipes]
MTGVLLAPHHDEFRGPCSDYVRHVALATTQHNLSSEKSDALTDNSSDEEVPANSQIPKKMTKRLNKTRVQTKRLHTPGCSALKTFD